MSGPWATVLRQLFGNAKDALKFASSVKLLLHLIHAITSPIYRTVEVRGRDELQIRMLGARQADKVGEQFYVQTEGAFWKYFSTVLICGWFWLLFVFAIDSRWSEYAILWFSLITVAASFLIARQIHWIWRSHVSKLKCRFYVTPLYFIQTHLDEVKWWPLWKLQDLKITHNYRNGGYQNTDLRLVFPGGAENLSVASKQGVENLLDWLRKLDQKMRQAVAQERWDYFASNDDFRSVTSQSNKQKWLTKSRSVTYGLVLSTSLMLMLSAYNMNVDNPSLPETSSQSSYSSPSYAGASNESPAQRFDEPAQPLPYNGTVHRYHSAEAVAPLEIKTRGNGQHYFVKIADFYTDRPIATIFVRDGSSAEILVPLGIFRLKYATGITWYGEDHRFGPKTGYYEADRAFHFTDDGYQYSGYTVELFLQQNGNLYTYEITSEQF